MDTKTVVDSDEVDDHFRYLLNLLEPHHEAIQHARAKAEYCAFWVWYEPGSYASSFRISAQLLSRAAALADDVNFSIIAPDSE